MASKIMKKLQTFLIAVLLGILFINSFASGDKDVDNKTETVVDGKQKEAEPGEVDWFGTDFKVCLTIAGIFTVVAIVACVYIAHKAKSRQDGVNLPKPLVDLGDY
ncbi:hypothetical protein Ocin01_04042 [Orchesella cincta]|uniref:Transmembrane protein n=1 Tax=Orchesella cincta TaxID=48709 RepID=A0A1D2NBL1_ORCCI|nr:hypothetical protein Ocin01_04042 [Orchesella cincta]